jgi:FAD binding domain
MLRHTSSKLLSKFVLNDIVPVEPISTSWSLFRRGAFTSALSQHAAASSLCASSFVVRNYDSFWFLRSSINLPIALSALAVLGGAGAAAATTLAEYENCDGTSSSSSSSSSYSDRTFVTKLEARWDYVGDSSKQHAVEDDGDGDNEEEEEETTVVINWSGTHAVTVSNSNFWEPETVEEVEEIVRSCHERGQTVRPLGSSLSPNGIALNKDGMISLANIDRVVEIDPAARTITVEAGMPVSKVRTSEQQRHNVTRWRRDVGTPRYF